MTPLTSRASAALSAAAKTARTSSSGVERAHDASASRAARVAAHGSCLANGRVLLRIVPFGARIRDRSVTLIGNDAAPQSAGRTDGRRVDDPQPGGAGGCHL